MIRALGVELLKLRRSPVAAITTLAVLAGTAALLAGVSVAIKSGNPELSAKVGTAGTADWVGLLALAGQIISAGWMLACGVMLAWIFAREFTEGTITALYALPTSRLQIAGAKLLSYTIWAVSTSFMLTVAVGITGICLGYGFPELDVWAMLVRQTVLAIVIAVVATPVATLASMFRSILGGVGSTIGVIVLAQVSALAGAGLWVPVAAPAMWALNPSATLLDPALLVAIGFGLSFAVLTLAQWRMLTLR